MEDGLTIFDMDPCIGIRHPSLGRRRKKYQDSSGDRHFGLEPSPFYVRHLSLASVKKENVIVLTFPRKSRILNELFAFK